MLPDVLPFSNTFLRYHLFREFWWYPQLHLRSVNVWYRLLFLVIRPRLASDRISITEHILPSLTIDVYAHSVTYCLHLPIDIKVFSGMIRRRNKHLSNTHPTHTSARYIGMYCQALSRLIVRYLVLSRLRFFSVNTHQSIRIPYTNIHPTPVTYKFTSNCINNRLCVFTPVLLFQNVNA